MEGNHSVAIAKRNLPLARTNLHAIAKQAEAKVTSGIRHNLQIHDQVMIDIDAKIAGVDLDVARGFSFNLQIRPLAKVWLDAESMSGTVLPARDL